MARKKVLVLGGAVGTKKNTRIRGERKAGTGRRMRVPSCGEANQESREIALDVLQQDKTSPRLVLAQNGTGATRPALRDHTAIYTDSEAK